MYPPQGPPPGFPPYGYAYPPRFAYPPHPPRRSAVPKTVGILAIIFSSLGLGIAALFTFGPYSDIHKWQLEGELRDELTWMWLSLALSAVVFAIHLAAGIAAVRYRPSAPRLVTIYAIVAVVFAILDLALTVGLFPAEMNTGAEWRTIEEVRDSVVTPRIVYEVGAMIWPVIAVILIRLRGSRAACAGVADRPQDVF